MLFRVKIYSERRPSIYLNIVNFRANPAADKKGGLTKLAKINAGISHQKLELALRRRTTPRMLGARREMRYPVRNAKNIDGAGLWSAVIGLRYGSRYDSTFTGKPKGNPVATVAGTSFQC
ncbi:hypothetical protein TNCV_228721 [Trichonephila clavipes]|nr:hypothetical protein TNCV_228721 [Trichonephila clavipes]